VNKKPFESLFPCSAKGNESAWQLFSTNEMV
jgi:hypothetical protein